MPEEPTNARKSFGDIAPHLAELPADASVYFVHSSSW